MTIHIDALTFNVIIGLLDFEREKPQSVVIHVEACYNYSAKNFIDYADIVQLIENELKEKRYELLEDALLGLKVLIHHTYPHIESLQIKIEKPDILPHCIVALSAKWTF
ncbi:MAG: Dihydroneopterin aldolase (EC [uncultured Sulfurovum sp.]|uniref:Dihydroneopterin aldolase (EC) n=1 Tax=uncultured Sulfurovum sp. TaxID=269237 RepID=A0A6S6TXQ2_9BACT|nr:MAG: Dihydroneopterin aldolase (EC [uncultured Sulfurovum sp.]